MNQRRHAIVWICVSLISFLLFVGLSRCLNLTSSCSGFIISIDKIGNHTVSPIVAQAALFFTYLASPQVLLLIAVCVCWILILIRERYTAALSLLGLTIGGTSSLTFKNLFLRARPESLLYVLPRSGYSFPSGHALLATVFYGFIAYSLLHSFKTTRSKVITVVAAVLLISAISYSRIVLHYHYVSDVIGGLLLGFSILSLLIAATKYTHHVWHKKQVSQGLSRILILSLIMLIGFWVVGFFVTHPLIIRSTIESNIQNT